MYSYIITVADKCLNTEHVVKFKSSTVYDYKIDNNGYVCNKAVIVINTRVSIAMEISIIKKKLDQT